MAMPTPPDLLFSELLSRPLHAPLDWKRREAKPGEVSLADGIDLADCSVSSTSLFAGCDLKRAVDDFADFLALQSIKVRKGRGVPLHFAKLPGDPQGRIRITVDSQRVTIAADNADGFRRGLVWLKEEMQGAEGPFLAIREIEKREVIRTRISRCFYGPIQRPPHNRNELADDVNYYPDGYLNRLAHDGVSALWITINLRESVPSKLFPEFGAHAQKHLAKLRATVAQVARYGIKIYVFCIEPAALDVGSPLLARHPELRGAQVGEQAAFCTESKLGQAYLEEATATLFEAVPGLGGMIVIPVGERFTTCASRYPADMERCPRCSKVGRNRVLYRVLEAFRRGMDGVAPEAELIAWPYGQMIFWGSEAMIEAAAHVPKGVVLQHNYETGGMATQLGKPRPLWDYWLSWAGVSPVFERSTMQLLATGGQMAAKLQVGNSHENATAPFLPVPGLLYRKYQAMHRLGVTAVMQSWYFGNYPSLMTRAAGLLSYAPLPRTEEEFLLDLARKEWGGAAPEVVRAWQCFGRGYENFPATHVFSYYGPVQNGVTWPLYLKPRRLPLSPSWKLDFPPSGDYLPHCFSHYFTLEELITLCTRLVREWQKGCEHLGKAYAASRKTEAQSHEWNIAEAIRLQFENALAILRFYQLREKLVEQESCAARLAVMQKMEGIVREEIQRRRRFLPLLRKEPVLGYHSEAEGFKITASLVKSAIRQLERLLEEEFPSVEKQAKTSGADWFGEYTGQNIGKTPCVPLARSRRLPSWGEWPREGGAQPLRYWLFAGSTRAVTRETSKMGRAARQLAVKAAFRMAATREEIGFQICLEYVEGALAGWEPSVVVEIEPSRMQPRVKFVLATSGECNGYYEEGYIKPNPEFSGQWYSVTSGRGASLAIPTKALSFPQGGNPFRMNIKLLFFHRATGEIRELSWIARRPMKARLIWETTHPATDYGWVLPTKG